MLFWKYSGAGNDFILIDDREQTFPIDKTLISNLCRRKISIGADGLILLQHSSLADYRMRIFNADGSEAEMCGNGLRCLVKFILQVADIKALYTIETLAGIHTARYNADDVIVSMTPPSKIIWNQKILGYKVHTINTGVPHATIFLDDIDNIDLNTIGKEIRYHKKFQPDGINVNIAKKLPNNTIKIRTYERGVEQETLACGTGATAVALTSKLKPPISILTHSRDTLIINFSNNKNITLQGPTQLIYQGKIKLGTDHARKNSIARFQSVCCSL